MLSREGAALPRASRCYVGPLFDATLQPFRSYRYKGTRPILTTSESSIAMYIK